MTDQRPMTDWTCETLQKAEYRRRGLPPEVTKVRCRGCGEMLSVVHSSGRRQSVTLYRIGCPIPSCGRIQHVGLIGEYIDVECAQAAVSPAGL